MDSVFLARLQFGLTAGFHYIFPPISIGLGLLLVVLEGMYLKTRDEAYRQATRFWVKIFALVFAIGVATGIVMEFEFGTNWSAYSRYVGDVFGSALAAEGIFAFFLESGFLAVLLFGWDKVSAGWHFFSTVMVCLGAHFSAIWIVVANSWQQTPAGHHVVTDAHDKLRAEIVSFWDVVFNPSTFDRITHTYMGAWQAGAFLMLSVGAYYLLRGRHQRFGRISIKVALPLAVVASLGQLATGHSSAHGVARNQPVKLAAMEGHYARSGPADLYVLGWVDEENETVTGLKIPGGLSWMVHFDASASVPGLKAVEKKDRPPVTWVFQTYHAMVALGMFLIGLSLLASFYAWRRKLFETRWLLWVLVFAVLAPQLANQLGWFTAEWGRQPWIVQDLLRTSEAVSPGVTTAEIIFSLVIFVLIYVALFLLFVYLLNSKIQHGPEAPSDADEDQAAGAAEKEAPEGGADEEPVLASDRPRVQGGDA
jgi:cytochrome d ubiquinol oxidase subunit I